MFVYFFRHGETYWNKKKKIQGQVNIPLNERGIAQSKHVGAKISDIAFDLAFSTPLDRGRQTAKYMLQDRTLLVHDHPLLLEFCYGVKEGESLRINRLIPWCKMYNYHHHPERYTPPAGGESFDDVQKRAQRFCEEVISPLEGRYEHIFVATHAGWIRSAVAWLTELERRRFWEQTPANCSATILECRNGKFSLIEHGKVYE